MSDSPAAPATAARDARPARARKPRSCNVGPGERGLRAVVAVIVGAFALSNLDNLWCAIPAGICATLLLIGAITGWCPTDLFNRSSANAPEPNTLGYPEAPQRLIG